ncbi:DNA helicase [Tanacetum coccineum]
MARYVSSSPPQLSVVFPSLGKRKCDDLNEGPKYFNNTIGHDIWNGGYGTTSVRQQCRRRSLYNGLGLPENDHRHNSANAGRYMAVGTSHTSGYAEGGVILDFADPTRHFFAEKQDSKNVDKFRCERTRYSRDYTYECLFWQTGSVSTQGESSRNNLGGEEQLRSTSESVYTFSCAMRDDPTSYLKGCSMGDEYSQRNSTNRGLVILDFENSVVHLPSVTGVSSGFQVVNAVDMLASQNNYPSNVDCPGITVVLDVDDSSRNNLNGEGHLWPTADSKGPVILDFKNSVVHLPSITGVSTGFQIANDVDMLATKNNYPPNVNHVGSPLFGDINSIHSNGQNHLGSPLFGDTNSIHSNGQNSAANVAHKPIQISDNVDSRKSHNTERPPLLNVVPASTRTYVNSNCEGVGSNVDSRRKNTRGRDPLPNVISEDIGDCDCSCQYCGAKFCMTSFGARVEDSINNGRAPYVFKISGEVYHWIGSLCPNEGDPPRDKCACQFVPDFKLRLYSVVGAREYDLPTSKTLGGIVFQNGQDTETDNDVIIQSRGGPPQRINKLHPSYMSLQFPLLFIFGQPEIKRHMQHYPEVLLGDIANVVVRVFHQKVQHFCKFLKDRRLFGTVRGLLYTIEFQKRGLPHCHTLLWIDEKDKIQCAEDIDRYISAELPNPIEDPERYRIISEMMIYGPCGPPEPTAPCMKENKCSKKFPKRYNDTTYFDKDGYAHYHRRQTNVYTTRHGVDLDNCYIVPYNRELCLTFHAHINVEYCGWAMLIKYLFKYISKGTDKILAQITRPVGEPSSQADRILSVHLENMQVVTFRDHQSLEVVANNEASKMTTLTDWFEYNKFNTDGRHLTYLDFPKYFVWYADSKVWSPRRRASQRSIGRLAHVHPSAGELFYLRILLCHQKGCKSFEDIRTVNDRVYLTFRDACEALGLLGDDKEWDTALMEACFSSTPTELRNLFVQLLIFCEVSDPMTLWRKYWHQMSDDIPLRVSKEHHIPNLHINAPELEQYVLFELEIILKSYSKTIIDFGLPPLSRRLLEELRNKELMEERSYNRDELAQEINILVPKLNAD